MKVPLSKKQESLLRSILTRHGRKKHNLCICEGIKACREAWSLRPDLLEFALCSENFNNQEFQALPFVETSKENFDSISALSTSEGILFLFRRPEYDFTKKSPDKFTILLDKVSDPGNLGTIIRTARAVGLTELWMTEGSADPYGGKVMRSALSSQFALKIRLFKENADAVMEFRRFCSGKIYVTTPHGGANCFTEECLFDESLIIFGNESHGTIGTDGMTDLTIPMPGKMESINLAQSLTVILFESVRRKTNT